MYRRLMDFLRCPDCGNAFDLEALTSSEDGVSEGILYCRAAHFFPVLRGIPRLLPDSIDEHWRDVSASIPSPPPASLANLLVRRAERSFAHDQRTKAVCMASTFSISAMTDCSSHSVRLKSCPICARSPIAVLVSAFSRSRNPETSTIGIGRIGWTRSVHGSHRSPSDGHRSVITSVRERSRRSSIS